MLVDPPVLPETAAPLGADRTAGPEDPTTPALSPGHGSPDGPASWRPRTSASAVADALVAARLPAPRPGTP